MPDIKEKLVELLYSADIQYSAKRRTEKGTTTVYDIADHLIAHGVTIQKWISVEERLPDPRTPVLTYGRKGAIGIGFTQPNSEKDGKVYFYARYGDHLPTHWMPLPEPPKEEV